MGFHYSSNRQDFLLQQTESFFKDLQLRLLGGKNEGKLPETYYDSLYEEYVGNNRSFFLDSSAADIIKHCEDEGFPEALELVARLMYETSAIADEPSPYITKSMELFKEHIAKHKSLSLENIQIYTALKEK